MGLYREALGIRTADRYPQERTLTILNYLEAGWHVAEEDPDRRRELLHDLLDKAAEVAALTPDEALRQQARQHLERYRSVLA